MLLQAADYKNNIEDFDTLLFSIWYHDIIYKSTKKDNEEKSAFFAQKRLKSLNLEGKRIENVQNLIISTKKHQIILDQNEDNAYLLDFDLSILGTDWKTYEMYTKQIRKEYKIYPDFMYKPGRKKVLLHFLERETLYFTKAIRNELENQARENLNKEIELL
jgi:predicted metal-dependent HD superfamily phosphohydrolase